MLQWGRGFESTETAFAKRLLLAELDKLQWGRGFESTETMEITFQQGLFQQASMGPWI